jgi:hypothetical protein
VVGGRVTANGVLIAEGSGGIDFVLDSPDPAFAISGQVTGDGLPLSNTGIELFDEFGNWWGGRETDRNGNYFFYGLPDDERSYRVRVNGPPRGYDFELYNNRACPDNSCDPVSEGDAVSRGATGIDLELPYVGNTPRFYGRVINSDSGQGVSSSVRYMGVVLYDAAGNYVTETGTDASGRYQFILPDYGLGAGDYMLVTTQDQSYHGLINEDHEGTQCFDDCNPLNLGTTPVTIGGGEPPQLQVQVDFFLALGKQISGTVTAANGGAGLADIEVCAARQSDGWWVGCAWTDTNGAYAIKGLADNNELQVFVNNTNGQPYQTQIYAELVDVTGGNASGIDFVLEAGFTISGNVSAAGGGPLEGVGVCIHLTTGEWTGVCGGSDANGNYQTSALPAGTDYVAYAIGEDVGYQRQMWEGLDCPNNNCDFGAGTPIELGGATPDATGIDFFLEPYYTISGMLTDAASNPVAGQLVCIGQLNGSVVSGSCRRSDDTGVYRSGPLTAGTDYIPFVVGRDSAYRSETWDSRDCPWNWCDLNTGLTLEVGGGVGDQTGIHFQLNANTVISGQIFDANDGAPIPLASGRARLYATDGTQVAIANTNADGNWYFGSMVPGSYYLVSTNRFGNLVDEVWDDIPCPRLSCDPATSGATLITVGDGDRVPGFDATLAPGSQLSGFLAADGAPISSSVYVYDQFGQYAAVGVSDDDGFWVTYSGLPAGTYYVTTRTSGNPSVNAEYFPVAWNNRPCGDPCDPLAGDPISLDGSTDVGGIDFNLVGNGGGSLAQIAGSVVDALDATPVHPVAIDLFDSVTGAPITGTTNNPDGSYVLPPVGPGSYKLFFNAYGTAESYIDELFDELACNNGACDIPNMGAVIEVQAGINQLGTEDLQPGVLLSGSVAAEGGSALEGVFVEVVAGDGSHFGLASTDATGAWQLPVLPGATYYATVTPWSAGDYIPEAWDGVRCFYCDVAAAGLPIPVGSTDASGIDFTLALGANISGAITESGSGSPIPGAQLALFDGQCNWYSGAQTDASGAYTLRGFDEGIYYVYADASDQGYVRELFPDTKRYFPCFPDITEGQAIAVGSAEQLAGVDFELDGGASISGVISDALTRARRGCTRLMASSC